MMKKIYIRFRVLTLSTVLKYVGVFVVGFYTNSLIQSAFHPQEETWCAERHGRQMNDHYKPKTKFEVIRYEYFNSAHLFSNVEDDTKIGLLGHHKRELKAKLDESLQRIREQGNFPDPIKLHLFKQGYKRIEPGWGSEFLLDLHVAPANNVHSVTQWRVKFSEPFCQPEVEVEKADNEAPQTVNFVVAVDNIAWKFRKFLISFSTTFLSVKESVTLTIVSSIGASQTQQAQFDTLVNGVRNVYPTAVIRSFTLSTTNFSRAAALHKGAGLFPREALLFFVDADVTVTRDFLYRCRMNTVRSKRVFYPIVFSQYKPDIVIKYSPQGKIKSLQDINKFTGHWVHYGYGMVCLYKEDYDIVGGFDLSITGWGGEDVDLYQKHVLSHLEVFRAMDPGLIHRYHDKQCDQHALTPKQWESCVGSQVNAYGSKMQLAWKILTEEKHMEHANFSVADD